MNSCRTKTSHKSLGVVLKLNLPRILWIVRSRQRVSMQGKEKRVSNDTHFSEARIASAQQG